MRMNIVSRWTGYWISAPGAMGVVNVLSIWFAGSDMVPRTTLGNLWHILTMLWWLNSRLLIMRSTSQLSLLAA
jgi:hypothetical protein